MSKKWNQTSCNHCWLCWSDGLYWTSH